MAKPAAVVIPDTSKPALPALNQTLDSKTQLDQNKTAIKLKTPLSGQSSGTGTPSQWNLVSAEGESKPASIGNSLNPSPTTGGSPVIVGNDGAEVTIDTSKVDTAGTHVTLKGFDLDLLKPKDSKGQLTIESPMSLSPGSSPEVSPRTTLTSHPSILNVTTTAVSATVPVPTTVPVATATPNAATPSATPNTASTNTTNAAPTSGLSVNPTPPTAVAAETLPATSTFTNIVNTFTSIFSSPKNAETTPSAQPIEAPKPAVQPKASQPETAATVVPVQTNTDIVNAMSETERKLKYANIRITQLEMHNHTLIEQNKKLPEEHAKEKQALIAERDSFKAKLEKLQAELVANAHNKPVAPKVETESLSQRFAQLQTAFQALEQLHKKETESHLATKKQLATSESSRAAAEKAIKEEYEKGKKDGLIEAKAKAAEELAKTYTVQLNKLKRTHKKKLADLQKEKEDLKTKVEVNHAANASAIASAAAQAAAAATAAAVANTQQYLNV